MNRRLSSLVLLLGVMGCQLETGPMEAEWVSGCFEFDRATSSLTLEVEFEACLQPGCDSVLETSCELVEHESIPGHIEVTASAVADGPRRRRQCDAGCESLLVQCSTTVENLEDAAYLSLRRGAWQGALKLDGTESSQCMYYDPGDYS